jgi:hypothetical protein
VRLGILRSGSLVRANVGAMALFGSWIGFMFIAVLYMQQLRGWSALETGLAVLPAGGLVPFLAPRVAPLIGRHGVSRVILVGLVAITLGYALFLPIGLDAPYATAMLPTMVLAGIGFAFAYGPLNIAATNGIAEHEQGLAGGLVSTSFQFGGALVLAVVTAVNDAGAGDDGSAQSILDGFHAALVVPLLAAAIGVAVTAFGVRRALAPAPTVDVAVPAVAADAGADPAVLVACDAAG